MAIRFLPPLKSVHPPSYSLSDTAPKAIGVGRLTRHTLGSNSVNLGPISCILRIISVKCLIGLVLHGQGGVTTYG